METWMSKVIKKVAMFYCMFNEYSNITYDVVFLCTGWNLEVAQDDILAK
jgi:hypothetical protein